MYSVVICEGYVQNYDILRYKEYSSNSGSSGTSLFLLTFIAWLPPAAICSIAMEKDKQGVNACYATNVELVGVMQIAYLLA